MTHAPLHTRFTKRFQLTTPIALAPMALATGGALAAACAQAGAVALTVADALFVAALGLRLNSALISQAEVVEVAETAAVCIAALVTKFLDIVFSLFKNKDWFSCD